MEKLEQINNEEWYNKDSGFQRKALLFDNLSKELIEAKDFCEVFGYSISTIYDWKYRPEKNNIPSDLFVKFRRKLYLRTEVIKAMFLDSYLYQKSS